MLRRRSNRGFSLAELMMAVAIIGILAGVSFIGVVNYLRSMALLERDGIAKEIFIAAQNHLTMAEGQNFYGILQEDKDGEPIHCGDSDVSDEDGIYYYVVNGSGDISSTEMISTMMPFGAIDETIRSAGSYIIRYQLKPALVLDVFYCSQNGSRFDRKLGSDDYGDAKAARGNSENNNKGARRNFKGDVLGWYGGEEASSLTPTTIEAPDLKIVNGNTLYAEITNPNSSSSVKLRLLIEGVYSNASGYFDLDGSLDFDLDGSLTVTLDDITTPSNGFSHINKQDGPRFSTFIKQKQSDSPDFIPGEDIRLRVMAYDNSSLSNIAYSSYKTTNSLFASVDDGVVSISSIRHLENLYKEISNFSRAADTPLSVVQTTDLSWPEFLADSTTSISVYAGMFHTCENMYMPVSPEYPLSYDGQNHNISGLSVTGKNQSLGVGEDVAYTGGNAGMFGTLKENSSVKNLAILDAKIQTKQESGNGNAGALAGTANNTAIENVIAYNTKAYTDHSNIVTDSGSAGGLVGEMIGGSISYSAASLYVESKNGDAGGLVGTISGNGVTVSGCYSGGHTDHGTYYDASTKAPLYNVIGFGNAGGLIGNSGEAAISNSYSTCSALSGKIEEGTVQVTPDGYVGGLVGTGSGSINNSYATGLVKGYSSGEDVKEGALAGSFSGTITDSKYFEIINEREIKEEGTLIGYDYLDAVGSGTAKNSTGIEAIDKDVTAYDSYVGAPAGWKAALPYDATLEEYYAKKYSLKTVEQLGVNVTDKYVKIHYGDWPAPELFVINASGGGS